jgi:hypothetical protein
MFGIAKNTVERNFRKMIFDGETKDFRRICFKMFKAITKKVLVIKSVECLNN